MSKPLTLSVTLSVLAMAALVLATAILPLGRNGAASGGAATAHGSLVKVLIQA